MAHFHGKHNCQTEQDDSLTFIVRGPEGATVHPPYDPTFWVSFCSLGSIISEKRRSQEKNSFGHCFLAPYLKICKNVSFSCFAHFLRVCEICAYILPRFSADITLISTKFIKNLCKLYNNR